MNKQWYAVIEWGRYGCTVTLIDAILQMEAIWIVDFDNNGEDLYVFPDDVVLAVIKPRDLIEMAWAVIMDFKASRN